MLYFDWSTWETRAGVIAGHKQTQWASQGLRFYSEADLITYLHVNSTPAYDWPTYLFGCPTVAFLFTVSLRACDSFCNASSVSLLVSSLCFCLFRPFLDGQAVAQSFVSLWRVGGCENRKQCLQQHPDDEWKVTTRSRNTKWDEANLSRTQENSRREKRWKGESWEWRATLV